MSWLTGREAAQYLLSLKPCAQFVLVVPYAQGSPSHDVPCTIYPMEYLLPDLEQLHMSYVQPP